MLLAWKPTMLLFHIGVIAASDKDWTVIEMKYKEKDGDRLWTGGNSIWGRCEDKESSNLFRLAQFIENEALMCTWALGFSLKHCLTWSW